MLRSRGANEEIIDRVIGTIEVINPCDEEKFIESSREQEQIVHNKVPQAMPENSNHWEVFKGTKAFLEWFHTPIGERQWNSRGAVLAGIYLLPMAKDMVDRQLNNNPIRAFRKRFETNTPQQCSPHYARDEETPQRDTHLTFDVWTIPWRGNQEGDTPEANVTDWFLEVNFLIMNRPRYYLITLFWHTGMVGMNFLYVSMLNFILLCFLVFSSLLSMKCTWLFMNITLPFMLVVRKKIWVTSRWFCKRVHSCLERAIHVYVKRERTRPFTPIKKI